MTRVLAVLVALIGLVAPPLALSAATSWMALLAHFLHGLGVVVLAPLAGWSGRPGAARGWGVLHVLVTLAVAGALHVGSWQPGGWGWAPVLALLLLWGWVPPALAFGAAGIGVRRRATRARRAVVARRAALRESGV